MQSIKQPRVPRQLLSTIPPALRPPLISLLPVAPQSCSQGTSPTPDSDPPNAQRPAHHLIFSSK
eukprot:scaffold1116_cov103-Isochrysis_galbana.AAC.11